MRTFPDRSLGIVAVNQRQRDLIEQLIDDVVASDPAVESYRQRWASHLEHFFVKNLENVQGDERDVIFISTVYGHNENGDFRQNFGPINQKMGHRRLNVLFTRAKRQVKVFTSMKASDIRIEPTSSQGVRVLKDYLQYAKTGQIEGINPGVGEPESEFERWFIDRLKARGYEPVPQVGVERFRIDIGVRHPDEPGSFILGVECDGATYHSAKSARDRDKLRQMVLEGLGWRIYRVWSTDWFRDASGELDR